MNFLFKRLLGNIYVKDFILIFMLRVPSYKPDNEIKSNHSYGKANCERYGPLLLVESQPVHRWAEEIQGDGNESVGGID